MEGCYSESAEALPQRIQGCYSKFALMPPLDNPEHCSDLAVLLLLESQEDDSGSAEELAVETKQECDFEEGVGVFQSGTAGVGLRGQVEGRALVWDPWHSLFSSSRLRVYWREENEISYTSDRAIGWGMRSLSSI